MVSTSHGLSSLITIWLGVVQDVLFPQSCAVCSAAIPSSETALCADCLRELVIIDSPLCTVCGMEMNSSTGEDHLCGSCLRKRPPFSSARAVVRYQEPFSTLLHKLKYQGDTSVLPALGDVIHLRPVISIGPDERIIPVPLHRQRLRSRGFNQAKLLAELFFPKNREQILLHCLVRTLYTEPQTALDGTRRRQNLRRAFAVQRAEQIRGRNIFLVDDVLTTGTTAAECSKVLLVAGARSVEVLTVARVVVRG